MKLITLNIWGGHVFNPLINFIRSYNTTDIFCFQEVYHNAPTKISDENRQENLNIFSDLQSLLPNHNGFFRPTVNNIYGNGIFIKKSIHVLAEGEVIIHDNPNYQGKGPSHPRNLQWIKCLFNNQIYSILNVHGLWNGQGKSDCPERIEQSKRIRNFMNSLTPPIILCGDLNLKPETESMKIIEEGMINLIKTNNVTSTRTSYYPKVEKFADYIIVSPDIIPHQFAVLKEEVSDHSPLYLDFT